MSRPLRICIVATEFPLVSESFVLDQATALVRRGATVDVLCDRVRPSIPNEDEAAAEVRRRAGAWWGPAAPVAPALRALPVRIADKLGAGLDRLAIPRLVRADVVLAHFGTNGSRVARLARRTGRLPPLVTIFHGFDVGKVAHDGTLWQYGPLFSVGALNLCVNGDFRRILVERAGAPAERTRVHRMGVDLDAIPFRPREAPVRRLLSVCRLTEKKGIDTALRALARLRDSAPSLEWEYRIVGDGELGSELRALADELGLASRVSFLGARPHAEVRAELDACDAFVLPSRTAADGDREGIPVALMEAMAAGLVVLSTRHSGIPELVRDGESGFLAEEGDVEGLAARLDAVISGKAPLGAVVRSARGAVEEGFDANRQNDRLLGILEEVAATRKAAARQPAAAISFDTGVM